MIYGGHALGLCNINTTYLRQKLYKILLGSKFAQQTVVNPATFQKSNHFITQMQFC